MYVFGGVCVSARQTVALKDLHAFDYVAKSWKSIDLKGDKPHGSWASASCAGPPEDGTGYVLGGRDPEYNIHATLHKYIAETETWVKESDGSDGKTPHPRICAGTMVCYGRTLIAFGGIDNFVDNKNNGAVYTNKLWVFDMDARLWREQHTTGSVPSPRGWHSAAADYPLGRMWVFGGAAERSVFNELYYLDVAKWEWTKSNAVGDIPPHCHSMVLIRTESGALIIHGGGVPYAHDTANCFHALECNSEMWRWHHGNLGLPPVVYGLCGAFFQGRVRMYFFGGQDAGGKYNNFMYTLERDDDSPDLNGPAPPAVITRERDKGEEDDDKPKEDKEKEKPQDKEEPLPVISVKPAVQMPQQIEGRPISRLRGGRPLASGLQAPPTAEPEISPSPRVLGRPSSVVGAVRPLPGHTGCTQLVPPSTAPARQRINEKGNWKDTYEVVKQIGRGGFSKIFLVRRKDTGGLFAAKRTDLAAAAAESRLKAVNEMKVHSSIPDHPFIVPFYEAYHKANSVAVIIMRHCDGGDLYTVIQNTAAKGEHIPEPQIAEWFVEITLAVQHLHYCKYLHADLKSANILLHNGLVQLCDFGMTDRPVQSHKREALKHHKEINGTPDYMSPEQLNYAPPSTATDVWALGILLYEMAALKLPFSGRTLAEKAEHIQKHPYETLPPVSTQLATLIATILSKRPQVRPTTAQILGSAFCEETTRRLLESPNYSTQFPF
eukprot:m51a1_g2523 putative protein kinase domain protein (719) ;mRNA; f:225399-227848